MLIFFCDYFDILQKGCFPAPLFAVNIVAITVEKPVNIKPRASIKKGFVSVFAKQKIFRIRIEFSKLYPA